MKVADESKLPPIYAEQIDELFRALKSIPALLQQGRTYGLAVGLSPVLVQQMLLRHGEEANLILLNTWRVDPTKSPSG
jgi:hypothetical protein